MNISLESPDQPEVLKLVAELDAFQMPLYPAESHHGIDIAALNQPNVLFAVARAEDETAIACGAILLTADYGELKRFYTAPFYRGTGVTQELLSFLEAQAKTKGCTSFKLETGNLQPAAIAFYSRCGYERCNPFGEYTDDPNSVFMCKTAY